MRSHRTSTRPRARCQPPPGGEEDVLPDARVAMLLALALQSTCAPHGRVGGRPLLARRVGELRTVWDLDRAHLYIIV